MKARPTHGLAGLGALALASLSFAQPIRISIPWERVASQASLRPETVSQVLTERLAESASLRTQAQGVTNQLAKLAAEGKVGVNDETVELMKKMVAELQQINERLKKVESELSGIQAWIETQDKAIPGMKGDIAGLKQVKPGGYLQVQFQNSDDKGAGQSAFDVRRMEFGSTVSLDADTKFKFGLELASGTTSTESQLRDAYLTKRFGTNEASAGQMRPKLGYELTRSSSLREMPEPAQYNRVMFSGDRMRGIAVRHELENGLYADFGVFDALSAGDREQTGLAPGVAGKMAWLGGLRLEREEYEVGLAALLGARPGFTDSAGNFYERTERRFVYFDGRYSGIAPGLVLRAEAMFGRDRVPVRFDRPSPGRTSSNMRGWQAQLAYDFAERSQVAIRYEQFDPNTGLGGDLYDAFGLVYSYTLSPGAKLSLAYTRVSDPSRPRQYGILTVRTQFKY
ncbi:MAG: porin [Fimbriimonadaceae bacterium]